MAQTTAYTSFGPVSLITGPFPLLIASGTYEILVGNKKNT